MEVATIEDAFVDGWNLGRFPGRFGLKVPAYYRNRTASVYVRREFERGVNDGWRFQLDVDASEAGCGYGEE